MKQCTSVHAYYGRCEFDQGHESGEFPYHRGTFAITTDEGFPGKAVRHWSEKNTLAERVAS